jgi:DUF4097 and DUF4098 domain-containing protein YvlB
MGFRPLITAVAFLAASGAMADVTEEQSWSFNLEPGGRFSLENINGNVTVSGGADNEVKIVAVKKAGSQDYLDGIEILVEDSSNAIRVETKHPDKGIKSWFNWGEDDSSGSVTYTITVPSSTNLESVESVNGNVSVSGVYGVVKAGTVNGQVDASDLTADARIETVNGTVNAYFTSFAGNQKATCESVNGRVTVKLPKDADASVTAETINGGIDGSDFGLQANKGFVGRDLEGEIGSGSARLSLSTVNGSIKIRSD